jgi:hypothetical protein
MLIYLSRPFGKKIEAKVMLNPAGKNQSLIQIQLLEKIEENEQEN